jgi:ribosomal-protein-alanine N-acetyltransferase
MNDVLDQVMGVMNTAFDPAYGEAWTRQQIADALMLPTTHILLAGADGRPVGPGKEAAGFALTRGVADEEELLLIAVRPEARRHGVGRALMARFIAEARARGAAKLFLEMREGNPAAGLYRRFGFQQVGLRRDYYNSGVAGPFNALTFALETQ